MAKFRSAELVMELFDSLSEEEQKDFLDHLVDRSGEKIVLNVEHECDSECDIVRKQLSRLAKAFCNGEANRTAFIGSHTEQAKTLITKAQVLGYADDKLELIYVPANVMLQDLLNSLHEVRRSKGYEGLAAKIHPSVWRWRLKVFGNYGIKDEPQLVLMVNGNSTDGSWMADARIDKRIAKKPKGLDFLTPAAYICADIVRTANGGSSSINLLDYSDRYQIPTHFPQYNMEIFVKNKRAEPLIDGGRLILARANKHLYSVVRFSVK